MIVRYAPREADRAGAALDTSLLYVVLDVTATGWSTSVRLYDPEDPDAPTIWPLADCEIVDNRVAPNWTLTRRDDVVTLAPAAWQVDGFWTRFWEGGSSSADDADALVIGLSPNLPVLSWSRRDDDVHAAYRAELATILTSCGFSADAGSEQFRAR